MMMSLIALLLMIWSSLSLNVPSLKKAMVSTLTVLQLGSMLSPAHADYRSLLQEAPQAFSENKVQQSVDLFDRAIAEKPQVKKYLWQLGISQYFNNQFSECSEQFTTDFEQNPDDTEEVVWAMLCNARKSDSGIEKARIMMPSRERSDPRPFMRIIESVYRGKLSEDFLVNLARDKSNSREAFYGNLYLALLEQAKGNGDNNKIMTYLDEALSNPYSVNERDYMVTVARIMRKRL